MDYLSQLPDDVLSLIFTVNNFNEENYREDNWNTTNRKAGRLTDLSITLTCKRWSNYGYKLLYSTVVLNSRYVENNVGTRDLDRSLRFRLIDSPHLATLVKSLTLDSFISPRVVTLEEDYSEGPSDTDLHLLNNHLEWLPQLIQSMTSLRQIILKGIFSNAPLVVFILSKLSTSMLTSIQWHVSPQYNARNYSLDLTRFFSRLESFPRLRALGLICPGTFTLKTSSSFPLSTFRIQSFTFDSMQNWIKTIFSQLDTLSLVQLHCLGEFSLPLAHYLLASKFTNLRDIRVSLGPPEVASNRLSFFALVEFLQLQSNLTSLELRAQRPYPYTTLCYLINKLPTTLRVLRMTAIEHQDLILLTLKNLQIRTMSSPIVYFEEDSSPSDPPGKEIRWARPRQIF